MDAPQTNKAIERARLCRERRAYSPLYKYPTWSPATRILAINTLPWCFGANGIYKNYHGIIFIVAALYLSAIYCYCLTQYGTNA
jgi:hypothetical protein